MEHSKAKQKTDHSSACDHPTINILYLLLSLDVGGLENGVVNLINHSQDKRFRHFVCCLRKRGPMENRITRGDVSVCSLDFKGGNDPRMPFRLARLMHKEKIHLVRCMNSEAFLYGFVAAKLARVPILFYSNGGRVFNDRGLRKRIERLFSRFTDQVTVVSDELKQKMVDAIGIRAEKILVMDNGVDASRFARKGETERRKVLTDLGLPHDVRIVGAVGRLTPEKDYKTLLSAFAIVGRQGPPSRLLIIGDGILRSELHEFSIELGIDGKVLFLGNRSDITSILSVMDVFVLTSISEGFSNVILEAMASSLPVVATDIGANRRMVIPGETGFITSPGDIDRIAQSILTLLQLPQRAREMGQQGRERVEKEFSIQRMVENYEECYRTHLRNKGVTV